MSKKAVCPKCGRCAFIIFESAVICIGCETVTEFVFLDDNKILCETRASDIVRLIEGA